MQISTASVEINMDVPQKPEIEVPLDPVIALLGMYLSKTSGINEREWFDYFEGQ